MCRYYIKRPNEPWVLCSYESYVNMLACMEILGDGYGVAFAE